MDKTHKDEFIVYKWIVAILVIAALVQVALMFAK